MTRLKPYLALFRINEKLTEKERREISIDMYENGFGILMDAQGNQIAEWTEHDTVDEIVEKMLKGIRK